MKLNEKIKCKLKETFSSLKHRNFRYFWVGQCISLMGTWMQRAAQVWLVYSITNSPFFLGLLGVFQFGPSLLLSLFAGVYVDKFPKKKILIFTQIVFMVQALALGVLVCSGHAQYWQILMLAAVFGVAQTIDMPARQSFFIELVGKEDLMNAISINSSIFNIAKVVGPALAGIVMIKFGPTICFFLNGLSFIPVLVGLFLINVNGVVKSNKNINIIHDIKQGLSYIWKNDSLKVSVFAMAIVCIFAGNTDVIMPVFAKQVLGGGASEYSVLLSFLGLGSFIGAIFMAAKSRNGPSRNLLMIQALGAGVAQIVAIFTRNYHIMILFSICMGFFFLTFLNSANATLQLNSSDEYRGRVMSVYALLNNGSIPIGNFFAGAVMQNLGGSMGFFVCGIITFSLICFMILIIKKKDIKSEITAA